MRFSSQSTSVRTRKLFHEHQIDGTDNKEKGQNVIPMQMGALKHDVGNDTEHSQRDTFLNDLQLNEVKRTAILNKTKTVGRHLTTILKESDTP